MEGGKRNTYSLYVGTSARLSFGNQTGFLLENVLTGRVMLLLRGLAVCSCAALRGPPVAISKASGPGH